MTEETSSICKIFSDFQDYLNDDYELRENIRLVVRDLEQTAREIQTHLMAIHQPTGLKNAAIVCQGARQLFVKAKEHLSTLAGKIPENQFYRFNDHWRFVTQRLIFLCALVVYLESDRLVTRQEVGDTLGVKVCRGDGFHIDLDDYLMGLLQLASELSRLAVNSVTAGDYGRPVRISKFVGELESGFRILNLKNDSIRKRFDALKYDLKKIEEVVYDLSIRGLKPAQET